MTYDPHALEVFFIFVYGFAAFWLLLFVAIAVLQIIRVLRNQREPRKPRTADFEVVGFRLAAGIVCLAVFLRRYMEWDPIILVPPLSVFAYTAMMNTVRMAWIIWREDHDPRSQQT